MRGRVVKYYPGWVSESHHFEILSMPHEQCHNFPSFFAVNLYLLLQYHFLLVTIYPIILFLRLGIYVFHLWLLFNHFNLQKIVMYSKVTWSRAAGMMGWGLWKKCI